MQFSTRWLLLDLHHSGKRHPLLDDDIQFVHIREIAKHLLHIISVGLKHGELQPVEHPQSHCADVYPNIPKYTLTYFNILLYAQIYFNIP